MVEKLGLDGINSHNAIDDAHATALLLLALAEARDLKHKITLEQAEQDAHLCKVNTVYGEFYRKWRSKPTAQTIVPITLFAEP